MRSDGTRSPEFEKEFLRAIGRSAGLDLEDWRDHIFERLDKGERDYGKFKYLEAGTPNLLREISEEAADIAGWAMLAAQALYAEEKLDDELRLNLCLQLQEAAAHGLRAWQTIARARDIYDLGIDPKTA